MKNLIALALIAPFLILGCSSNNTEKTEATLAAAGFRAKTPSTSNEKALYDALPAYKIHQGKYKDEIFYAFKDEEKGLAYVGNQEAYQKYQQLVIQKDIADSQRDAAMMNEMAASSWYGTYYRPIYYRPYPVAPPMRPLPGRPRPF